MIITCPQCATRYSMSATVVGTEGRRVRCSRCGAVWHQELVAAEPRPQPMAAPPQKVVEAAPAYARPYPPPPPADGFVAAPTPQPQPIVTPPPPPPPRVAEEQRVREPEPPPEELRSAIAEPEPAAEELRKAFADDSGAPDAPHEEPDDAGEPVQEELGDDEPMPEVFPFRARGQGITDAEEEGRGRKWGLILGIPILVLLAVGIGAYFGQEMILSYVPEATPLYRSLGLYTEKLGAGLELRRTGDPERINQEQGLLIRGTVANVSDQPRPVPLIKISFLNLEGEAVQSTIVQPAKSELPPAEQLSFQARIDRLAPTARKIEITFTTPELEGRSAVTTSKN